LGEKESTNFSKIWTTFVKYSSLLIWLIQFNAGRYGLPWYNACSI